MTCDTCACVEYRFWLYENRRFCKRCALRALRIDENVEQMPSTCAEPQPVDEAHGISPFDFNTRAFNCLVKAGYKTIAEVRAATDRDLKRIPLMGKATIAHIRQTIAVIDKPQ